MGKLFLWGKGAGRRSVSLYLSSYPRELQEPCIFGDQETGSRCVTGDPRHMIQSGHDYRNTKSCVLTGGVKIYLFAIQLHCLRTACKICLVVVNEQTWECPYC